MLTLNTSYQLKYGTLIFTAILLQLASPDRIFSRQGLPVPSASLTIGWGVQGCMDGAWTLRIPASEKGP